MDQVEKRPKKRNYIQRAHCNPLSVGDEIFPQAHWSVNWALLYNSAYPPQNTDKALHYYIPVSSDPNENITTPWSKGLSEEVSYRQLVTLWNGVVEEKYFCTEVMNLSHSEILAFAKVSNSNGPGDELLLNTAKLHYPSEEISDIDIEKYPEMHSCIIRSLAAIIWRGLEVDLMQTAFIACHGIPISVLLEKSETSAVHQIQVSYKALLEKIYSVNSFEVYQQISKRVSTDSTKTEINVHKNESEVELPISEPVLSTISTSETIDSVSNEVYETIETSQIEEPMLSERETELGSITEEKTKGSDDTEVLPVTATEKVIDASNPADVIETKEMADNSFTFADGDSCAKDISENVKDLNEDEIEDITIVNETIIEDNTDVSNIVKNIDVKDTTENSETIVDDVLLETIVQPSFDIVTENLEVVNDETLCSEENYDFHSHPQKSGVSERNLLESSSLSLSSKRTKTHETQLPIDTIDQEENLDTTPKEQANVIVPDPLHGFVLPSTEQMQMTQGTPSLVNTISVNSLPSWMNTDVGFPLSSTLMDFPCSPESADILDIGCGYGSFLFNLAEALPMHRALGVELRKSVAEYVKDLTIWKRQHENKAHNAMALRYNAQLYLSRLIAVKQLMTAFILFPDPQFKAQHAKRHIVSTSLLRILGKALRDNGRIYFVTDVESVYTHAMNIFTSSPFFSVLYSNSRIVQVEGSNVEVTTESKETISELIPEINEQIQQQTKSPEVVQPTEIESTNENNQTISTEVVEEDSLQEESTNENTEKVKEIVQDVVPEVTLDVIPEVTLDVVPEVSLDVVPEVTLDLVPEVSLDVVPEVSLDVVQDVTLETKPTNEDVSECSVSSDNEPKTLVHFPTDFPSPNVFSLPQNLCCVVEDDEVGEKGYIPKNDPLFHLIQTGTDESRKVLRKTELCRGTDREKGRVHVIIMERNARGPH